MSLKYWAMIAGLGIIWGTSFAMNEILLREIGPLSISMGRVLLGAAFCWAFVFATGRDKSLPSGKIIALFLLGATNFALPLAIYPISQAHLASGVAGIMNGLTPVAVVIISQFWPGGERANVAKFTGVTFGFLGIYLLAIPSFAAGDKSELWALLIILVAPISYGVSLNIMRQFKGYDPIMLVTYALSLATVLLAPLVLWREGLPVITQAATWAALAWIGFVATGFAFICLYWLVPRVGGTNMSTATFIAPVSAILLGVFLLGEVLETAHLLGMAAIFCGMLMIDGRIIKLLRRTPASDTQSNG